MKIDQRHHHCRINEYLYRGHRLVVLENQYLKVGVLATKGADIVEFRYKPLDLDVLWHSPQGILPPAHHIPTKARSNGSFLDYYQGGWQEILPNPGDSVSYLNAELGQHGETALLPWEVSVVEDSPDVIAVEFSVRTVRMPFLLTRRIEIRREDRHVRISEALSNEGEERIFFGWGHHPCFGEPFLGPGCEIDLPPAKVNTLGEGSHSRYRTGQVTTERTLRTPAGDEVRVDEVPAKSSRTEDVIYFDELSAGWYALRNPRLEQRCCMDRGGDGIRPFPSGSVRRYVRTQAVRVRSLCSGLSGRPGSP